MRSKGVLVLAAVILFQCIVVVLASTPRPHNGGDNAGYISLAHSLLEGEGYREQWDPEEPPHTKYPPVFPLFLVGAVLLGAKTWAGLKIVPALSTLLAVIFTFLWVRDRRGLALGAVVAGLLGLSSAVVYYSQWILSDPTFLALTMGALWALHRAGGEGGGGKEAVDPGGGGGRGTGPLRVGWLALALVFLGLAYFTRSAGLPLVLAAGLWLLARRNWKALAALVLVLGVPAFLWWLRGSGSGGGDYVSEFWLLDPYRPHLGTVGFAGLVERATTNFTGYLGRHIPGGIVGGGRAFLPPLGVALFALWAVGWVKTVRDRVGVAELFCPLYLGLILLWPATWSGDRFALPLFPLVFFYAGVALHWLLGGLKRPARAPLMGVLVAVLAFPAGQEWLRTVQGSLACREASRGGNPGQCLAPQESEYFALASWAGESLPYGAVVVTRKPRLFFVMSGLKTLSVPFLTNPDQLLAQVRGRGSRYLTLDRLDSVSGAYLYPVLQARLGAFCDIGGVGEGEGVGARLLGILEREMEQGGEGEAGAYLPRCSSDMLRGTLKEAAPAMSWEIPLLTRKVSAGNLEE